MSTATDPIAVLGRVADAMERGMAETAERHGAYLAWWPEDTHVAACAIGALWAGLHPSARAAVDAFVASDQQMHTRTYRRLGIGIDEVMVWDPTYQRRRDILETIEELFEVERWSRARIVAWLREQATPGAPS